MSNSADYIVVGAGSAGCVVAGELVRRGMGQVLVLEAGPSDRHPLVKMPFGLVWLMGSKKRDWKFHSTPQKGLGGRVIKIPRGRMLGGSGSINSMVWFRGCASDFEAWQQKGWSWPEVETAFEAVEAELAPSQLQGAHPLTQRLSGLFGNNSNNAPTPEYQSAGVFRYNMRHGRRWSAMDAYLRPAIASGKVDVLTGSNVDKLGFENGKATTVHLVDGRRLTARKGIILSAGAIGSPSILLRSGVGPAADLKALGIALELDAPEVGKNLHDHPSVGVHFAGPKSGYGITLDQALSWIIAPFRYALKRSGRLASPTVEGGAFFASSDKVDAPDVQSHFIPFNLGWTGNRYTLGSGYFADVCLCRPKSRGALRLTSVDPNVMPEIDLGLLTNPADLDSLAAGFKKLRQIMSEADFGPHKAPEVYPASEVTTEDDVRQFVKTHCATAYHPVGTLRMGGPVRHDLKVTGIENLWVADASVMPSITSANTNAPSMMIGWKAADFIAQEVT